MARWLLFTIVIIIIIDYILYSSHVLPMAIILYHIQNQYHTFSTTIILYYNIFYNINIYIS